MRVSMKWLRELVDVDLPTDELVDLLDMTGTKVEAVHTLGAALEGVFVGRILTKERHPDADTLWVTTVDVGEPQPLQIVCGAQNFEAGDKVPVAVVGAVLPNGMTIKKAKLRGVVSEGMNCSPIELGIGTEASGLLVLPADAPVGMPFAAYHGMADTVLELEVTPNRPDCLSMAGVAREVGAVTGKSVRSPGGKPEESGTPAAERVSITIEDADLCPRYTARLITGVKIAPSPDWLVERVTAAGARPINNIVDITNYVMFEMGQPLHAFDAATLGVAGGKIAIGVRVARAGEKLTTLDGVDRDLVADTLMITDPSGVIALAGVMGGETTEVSDATVDILLESACFKAASVGRTSRRLGLISEASQRFERGVDPNGGGRPRRPTHGRPRRRHRGSRSRRRLPRDDRAARTEPACRASELAARHRADGRGRHRYPRATQPRRGGQGRHSARDRSDVPARPRARSRPDRGGRARARYGQRAVHAPRRSRSLRRSERRPAPPRADRRGPASRGSERGAHVGVL
jgi:phenylalanyl-tRNA synthetase beta chain